MTVKECLDANAIRKLDDLGGGKLVVRMIELFTENSTKKIQQALEAWNQKDFHTIERSAHSLVSSTGNLGAVRMQELASRIEQMASKGDTDEFPTLLHELRESFEEVQSRLDEVKKGYNE